MPNFLPFLTDLVGPAPSAIAAPPDTHVYQLRSDVRSGALAGASTKQPDSTNDLLNVHALLGGQSAPVPAIVAAQLAPGPYVVCTAGSPTDMALAAFPTLVQLVIKYNADAAGGTMAIEGTPVAIPASTGLVRAGAGEFVGYTVRETSGSAGARVTVYDSATAASGTVLEEITLNAGESADDEWGRPGRLVQVGIYVGIVGAVEGSVFV